MKQIVRRVIDAKGRVSLLELPEPHFGPHQVLVQTAFSLISSGTELSTITKTPTELIKQTIADPWMRQAVKSTVLAAGWSQTARRIWQEMVRPREIGYSGSGTVLATGEQVEGLRQGDRVAFAAVGHAEIVAPYGNHVVPLPDTVPSHHAAFVTVGGIVIQALRRADLRFGEVVAVYGLGLLGQLCAMVAKAAGCVVVGIDIDDRRTGLAARCGADLVVNPTAGDLTREVARLTGKQGVDATIICASSKSDAIINTSMDITRKQGRVVVVGYVKLNIHPKNFLYKEIDLRYSRAYGPGSYHLAYERGRVDYPFGYVRWTERRNLGEFVRLLASKAINPEPLISGVYPVSEAQTAFDAVTGGTLESVAALIRYDEGPPATRSRTLALHAMPRPGGSVGISIIGAGSHALGVLMPELTRIPGVQIRGIASATGKDATVAAKATGAAMITTDVSALAADEHTDGIVIASSPPEHAGHILQAVGAGKGIYLEKPMVTLFEDFKRVWQVMDATPVLFTMGLNRRYSPLVAIMREMIEEPVQSITYLINQQPVPADHRTVDEFEGGGRLVSEAEHFIDLCNFVIGHPPTTVQGRPLGPAPGDLRQLSSFALTLWYDGAVANIIYDESGASTFPRERVTATGRGQVATLDDFARLTIQGRKKREYGGGKRQMGHREALTQFVSALRGESNTMLTWQDASLATLCVFAAQESIRSGEPVDLRRFRSVMASQAGT